jgi:pyrroline-5-carboxylate reductase
MVLLNAVRSSGLRLVVRLPSTTTCSSTQSAPALRRSVCSEGQVDGLGVTGLDVVVGGDGAGLEADQPGFGPRVHQCLPGLVRLDLLDTVGGQHGHPLPAEFVRHGRPLPRGPTRDTPGTTVAAVTTGGRSGLAIIGGGKIGEALLAGLVRQARAGGSGPGVGSLVVVERSPARAAELAGRYGVDTVDLPTAAQRARVLLLAVKPQDIDALLGLLGPHVTAEHLVVSIAAGVPTARIEAALPAGTPVVRVMPNTPALVDEGMSVLSAGAHATEAHLDEAETLLSPVGQVRRVPENQQDAVTALSGSGPAYFFFLVEAMIDAGILLGLPRTVAADLIVQTALGAAVMLRDSGEHPVQLREAVTSPGGTTIAAIRELERHGVRAALIAAIEAAHQRSVELGRTE